MSLARQYRPRPTREQPERVIESGCEPIEWERASPCGSEFQRQRYAIEAGADRRDCRCDGVVEDKVRTGGAGTVEEQPHGIESLEPFDRVLLARLGDRQRRHSPHHLARHAEWLATGDQHPQIRTRRDERVRDSSDLADHMLCVVEHEQGRVGGPLRR